MISGSGCNDGFGYASCIFLLVHCFFRARLGNTANAVSTVVDENVDGWIDRFRWFHVLGGSCWSLQFQ